MRLFAHLPIRALVLVLLVFASGGASNAAQRETCEMPGDLVIAAEDAFFPYSGLYKGKLRGFAVDIVTAAFDAAGCSISFDVMPYNRCLREVARGRQLGCFNTTGSEENRRKFLFHQEPLFNGKILIFGHPEDRTEFRSEFFKQKTFAVVRGYTFTDEFSSDSGISTIEVDSDLQTLALVARKRADYAVVYEKVAAFHISNSPDVIAPAPNPVRELGHFDLYVSFSKELPGLSRPVAHVLDTGLEAIHRNGTYDDIESTWDEWLTVGLKFGRPAPHWIAAGAPH